MKQLKIMLTIIIMTTLVGCNMNNEKKYDSYEEEMKEKTEKYVGNGWYEFDENNENHQAVLKDFPYADLEEIPIIRFETETTIAYGYEIKYAEEVKRRNKMMQFDVYDLFQDRYIDFMEESNIGLAEYYEIDGLDLKLGNIGDTNAGEYAVTFVAKSAPYIAISFGYTYEIEPDEVQLNFRPLMNSDYYSVNKRVYLRKLLENEIVDYGKWLEENTDGCSSEIVTPSTGLGFDIDERLYTFLKDSGMDHQAAVDYEKQMYEIIGHNMDKNGKELKVILKDEIGLESYKWIEFVSDCGVGGDSPVRPPGEMLIDRKELYKGLITYSDIKIRIISKTKYFAVYYIHPSKTNEKYGTVDKYGKNIDKILVTENTIDDHNSWYSNRSGLSEKYPGWSTTTVEDRGED